MQFVSKKFYIFLSSTPLVSLIVIYSFALRVYLALGRIPQQINAPDPRELHFEFHRGLVYGSIILIWLALLPWIGVTIGSWYKKSFSKKFLLINGLTYIVSFAVFMILVRYWDPWNFMWWFWD